ncbi:MAG: hypothetical protein U9Q78_01170 [Chloroflexota bacterium]|nr:hypothetical protein [Chloroflexota bacterium]
MDGLYLANLTLRWGMRAFGFRGLGNVAAFPLLALAAFLFGLITQPLGNTPLIIPFAWGWGRR